MTSTSPPIECAAIRLAPSQRRIANKHVIEYADLAPVPSRTDGAIEHSAFVGPGDHIRAHALQRRDAQRSKEQHQRNKRAMAIHDHQTMRDILDEMLNDET